MRAFDVALTENDISTAVRALHDAGAAARRSRRWEAMLAIGDAHRRIAIASGSSRSGEVRARDAYQIALLRARRDGSLAGVLQTAHAFAALGDDEVVEQCLRVAAIVAETTHDHEGAQQVRALRERWTAERHAGDPAGALTLPSALAPLVR